MAEGGDSVDSGRNRLCDICFKEGRSILSVCFCQQCEQYFCVDCKNYHLEARATRSHEIKEDVGFLKYVSEAQMNMPSLSSLSLGSEPVDPPVCKEHGHEFKYFCKSHKVELCLTCRRMEHKNCKTVINIEQAAREIYSESHGGKIIQSVKQLAERFGECQATVRKSKTDLPGKRQFTIDSVKQTRKSVDAYFDKLEAHALAEIDEIFYKETKTLDEQINICNASKSFLTASLSILNRMISVGNKEEKFIEINRATKQIKQYCNMLHDLSQELCDINLKFEENENVSKLNILLQDLGKCSVVRSSVSHVTMAKDPIYSGEILLTTSTGPGDPHNADDGGQRKSVAQTGDEIANITSFDVLPDGRRLLIDAANKKLKLYDRNNFLITEHVLSVVPFHVVVLSNTEAVVSTGTNTPLKVKIGDGLAVTETKSKYSFGMGFRSGEDITAILCIGGIFCVSVLDKGFTIKKTIIKDDNQTLFRFPLCLAISDGRSMLFVLDGYNGCFGFTMDGQVQFHYQDQERKYFGIAVGRDSLFLGTHDEKNRQCVQKVNFSGERVACADFGESWPLRVVDNELVLFTKLDKGNVMINFHFLL